MKSCKFIELRVLSHIQRAGRTIQFGPDANVLLGPNGTGKSSIIKTLYWTLGAEPSSFSHKWTALDVKALLRFSLGDQEWSMFRDGGFFALFDAADKLVSVYRSTSKQLAPQLARLFDFKLQLSTQKGDPATPTPAFQYLPYYIDQDGGWAAPWSSFTRLQQFKDWKRDTIEYHAGIKPNAFYKAKAEFNRLQAQTQEPRLKRAALNTLQQDVSERLPPAVFSIDIDAYKKEIAELIDRCRVLRDAEDKYKQSLLDIENRRAVLVSQQGIVRGVGAELHKDYEYAAQLPEAVECPTCGEAYRNGFSERFAIAHDEDRCVELETDISRELEELDDEQAKIEEQLSASQKESDRAAALLASKQGDVTLQQLIRNEGRREVKTLLAEEAQQLDATIATLDVAMQNERDKMEKYTSRERRKDVTSAYREIMHASLNRLNVLTLPEKSYRNLTSKIHATGSETPRAVLAYVYTFLQLIKKYSDATFFPIVVDAVNQQEQDDENLRRMLKFIRDDRPAGSQLIVGVVDAKGLEFDGKIIHCDDAVGALRDAEYGLVAEQMRPFLAATTTR